MFTHNKRKAASNCEAWFQKLSVATDAEKVMTRREEEYLTSLERDLLDCLLKGKGQSSNKLRITTVPLFPKTYLCRL